MDIKNLTGLEQPLVKLVETVSDGVGVVGNHLFEFDAKKAKRIGEAEADVEKQKIIKTAEAKVHAEKIEILERAKIRFEIEQYNKQRNIENTFVGARDLLEGKVVSEDPVDKDWAQRFIGVAEDVSREDLQKILSKILAEEVESPESYSLRTLDVVKNLSRVDLEVFKRIAALYMGNDKIIIPNAKRSDGGLSDYNVSYLDILHSVELGLVDSNTSSLIWPIEVKAPGQAQVPFMFQGLGMFYIPANKVTELPILRLTKPGSEIASLVHESSSYSAQYKADIVNFLAQKNISMMLLKTDNTKKK